jgi:hypothetical protein
MDFFVVVTGLVTFSLSLTIFISTL